MQALMWDIEDIEDLEIEQHETNVLHKGDDFDKYFENISEGNFKARFRFTFPNLERQFQIRVSVKQAKLSVAQKPTKFGNKEERKFHLLKFRYSLLSPLFMHWIIHASEW